MKKLALSLGLAACALVCAVPAQAEIVLTFEPATKHLDIGGSVTINVSISGLGSEILSAFDLNFKWDAAIINWTSLDATSGCAQLQAGASCGFGAVPQGNIALNGFSRLLDDPLAAVQADSFLLASFTFVATGNGATFFTLGLDPDFERNFVGRRALSLPVTIGGTCVSVGTATDCATVPEPATFGLASLALAGALLPAALRRRRQTTA